MVAAEKSATLIGAFSIPNLGLEIGSASCRQHQLSQLVTQRELGFSACCRMHISPSASKSVQAAASSSA